MQAVILVGGQGTRLRPLTDTRPKPMMSVADRPFVAYQLDLLRRHGVKDVVFSCGYRPEALETYFGDGASHGLHLSYVVDPEPLGTAGAIKNAESELDPAQRILVLNGDILTDLDIAALAATHERSGALGTLTLTDVDDPSRYGLVRLFDDGRVEAFVEKPSADELRPGEPFRINAGTYLFEPGILAEIPAGVNCSIERDVFPRLAADGRLAGHPATAYWRDIGTPESYLQANLDVLSGGVASDGPTGSRYLGDGADVAPDAVVDGGSCIGPQAAVASGARVHASVVGAGARIGMGAQLDGAIVGAEAVIGDGARLGHGVVVGDRARIHPGVAIVDRVVATDEDLRSA